ncbi:MAG: FecR family protein [Elusimicrobiales bacterium]|jgi:ferric-dicitrate binding protein FerR (iron transport regulator)
MKIILTVFLLACPAAFADAAGGPSAAACVYKYTGAVQLMEPGTASWRALDGAVPLREGARLRTGPGASCEILAGDGTFINLYENSETTVETLRLEPETRDYGFNFIKGRILWLAAKVKRKVSKFEIRTPSAVCAVRGTDFAVDVSSAATDIGLFEGQLDIKNNGKETPLAAGSEAVAGPGTDTLVSGRFSALMEAEKRRYLKLRSHAEDLRKKLAEREGFIDGYLQGRQKKLQALDSRRREKLDKRNKP